ncbi:hypothetical protein EVAR_84757_1 [Eumeta japonica]|uniref:Uncharacterized protein n=1 Tax=Eumeta variegata TaxID=151549 RepID=A0A4C1U8U1_EUMVA|nr:hypothetical protein EVAR_84757_1 [Eumeta japonica]
MERYESKSENCKHGPRLITSPPVKVIGAVQKCTSKEVAAATFTIKSSKKDEIVNATIWSSLQYLRKLNKASETLTMVVMWCMKCICTVTTMCLGCDKLYPHGKIPKYWSMDYERRLQTRLPAKGFLEHGTHGQ